MRVSLTIEGSLGFFPGLARPIVIDDAALPPDQAVELRRLVAAADLDHRAPPPSPPSGAADYRTYTLTIEDGAAVTTVRSTDLDNSPALSSLFQFIQSLRPRP